MLSGLGKAPKISVENPDRTFPRIQSGADGAVIACSDEKASKDASAGIMALSCEAENGVLRIIRRNSDGTGKRPCTVNTAKHKPKAIICDVSVGDKSGFASVGITIYHGGKSEYTLIVSGDG